MRYVSWAGCGVSGSECAVGLCVGGAGVCGWVVPSLLPVLMSVMVSFGVFALSEELLTFM
jgi:hypothetical protein